MNFVADKRFYSFSCGGDTPLAGAAREMLDKLPKKERVLRVVFFGDPADNAAYLRDAAELKRTVGEWGGAETPVVSYVAQKPLGGESLIMEATTTNRVKGVEVRYCDNYIVFDDGSSRELIMGGVLPGDIFADTYTQAADVFGRIYSVMMREGFALSAIVRQWNYVENITTMTGARQNYQMFNDARSEFYAKGCWGGGFPAATGIGTSAGGVMVELNAVAGVTIESVALDNPLQVAAHCYSKQVLVGDGAAKTAGPSTPKFERGRMLSEGGSSSLIYISGTAAIRGEHSLAGEDMESQTRATMENIEALVSGENTGRSGKIDYRMLRVYIKYPEQVEASRKYMEKAYPRVPTFYIHADICRDELLMEIEGVAVVE